jgi:hypothetical protein
MNRWFAVSCAVTLMQIALSNVVEAVPLNQSQSLSHDFILRSSVKAEPTPI